jgi:chromosome partitioning protein
VSGYDAVLVDCQPSLGVLALNALAAASHLVLVTEPSFLALQGLDELLETRDLVQAHYNARLALAGVIVNRVERTVEHRMGLAEITSYFGPDPVWSPAPTEANRAAGGSAARHPDRRGPRPSDT